MNLTGTHRLGSRAFLLFLNKRLKWPLVFLIVFVVLWSQREKVPLQYRDWSDYGLNICFLIWIGLAVFVLLRSFFEYRGYSFRFDEEYFHVTRGYFLKHEMGIVYHQIQHVTVKCGILDRMAGVGDLIIITNVGSGNSVPSEIILPALDKRKAQIVQRELLRKAQNTDRAFVRRPKRVTSSDAEDVGDGNAEELEDEEDEEEEG